MSTLLDCITEHPGGWQDIYDALAAHSEETLTVTRAVRRIDDGGTTRQVTVEDQHPVATLLEQLQAIEHLISGVAAAHGQRALFAVGLPTHTDPRWLQSAVFWFT